MRGKEDLNKGGGYVCLALRPFLIQLAGSPGCAPNDCFWFERFRPGTVLWISWTSSFECCAGCHTVRAGAFQCSPAVVGEICDFKILSSTQMQPPPPLPMTTAFGGIGVVSNEWARDQCPTGLVSTGVKSGVKVTAVSTVRGSV